MEEAIRRVSAWKDGEIYKKDKTYYLLKHIG